jgi:hypothetical protein
LDNPDGDIDEGYGSNSDEDEDDNGNTLTKKEPHSIVSDLEWADRYVLCFDGI